ncbi:glyoxalase/bleomycin resistance/dioxygenase family protein [Aestuariibacter halophilus]|uniref:Glyoxalase/bleomycin resistance/dioxygenase family protein n=1 Tax=Fluctibacter halophilus TaxID=226011 RepID=A0ABS8G2X9_9ALTE|nr:glyoxalase/bleomycin resistance/dioxygenase family protein [Aestuariibacter halophilus]MCC2614893.1 glyoxalase/bleomycin resistance/dioxygenase family protein [Aestuariibacter halophilus]
MDIERFGIILNVANFDDCVSFYKSLFGLRELFTKRDGDFRLTCLEFGSAYLMIETGGVAASQEKTFSQSPTVLRFHVEDTQKIIEQVQRYDLNAKRFQTDWGNIIRCIDPDGNPISIRESSGFEG